MGLPGGTKRWKVWFGRQIKAMDNGGALDLGTHAVDLDYKLLPKPTSAGLSLQALD